jgi:hypothetical protein
MWNFDLTKAFDMLEHAKALDLLHGSGIYGQFGIVIQNWLTKRTQTVEVGSSKSEERMVGRSCVQGSVLGPTLWLLYIQSLTIILDRLGVDYMAYADDISIFQRISTLEEKKKFEGILKILQVWAKDYGMRWSPLKTQRMVFRYQNLREPHPPFEMTFGGKIIPPLASTCISLGVLFDKNCTFTSHITKVYNQIRALTSFLRQEFANITPALLKTYYQVYVTPALIYCSQVWNPGNEAQLKDIEKAVEIFWRLSKKGPPKDHISPRLHLLILDLNYVKKLWDGKSVINFDEMFQTPVMSNSRPNDEEHLGAVFKKLNISRRKFSFRTRAYWNLLPKDIRYLTYSGFKTKAKEYVLKNSRKFLNLGNKDKEVDHKIFELADKLPAKKVGSKAVNKKIVSEKIKTLRRLNKNIMNAPNVAIPDSGSARVIKKPLKQDVINTKRKK